MVAAVRLFSDGPIVMAGGRADGHAVWAARAPGCDLAYIGTAFIATHESRAEPRYKQMLVDIWSARHSVAGAHSVPSAADRVAQVRTECEEARAAPRALDE
jgi:NAD(P)H-dependent flavin oxidoreductase YrpB (nitropropane dioxygenase family)